MVRLEYRRTISTDLQDEPHWVFHFEDLADAVEVADLALRSGRVREVQVTRQERGIPWTLTPENIVTFRRHYVWSEQVG